MRELEKNSWIALMAVGYLAATILSACGGGQSAPPPIAVSISPSSVQSVDQGQSVNFTAAVANDTAAKGVSWSLSGSGCTGASCGTISAQNPQSATYVAPSPVSANLTVKIVAAAIANNTKSSSGSITVVPPPTVTATSLPGATVGVAYSAMLHASGGVTPYSWLVSAGTFPPGLNLNGDGSISGSPSAGGTFNFTVQVADSGNPSLIATANLSIAATVLPLSITTKSMPDGTVDVAYKQPVQAAGGIPPYTWSIVSGSLPSWATQNSATGSVNGIPGATGSSSFIVHVMDSETPALTSQQALSITVGTGSAANNSELSGHYAFLFHGFDDATGSQVAAAGSFTADGKGKITAGIEDENGPGGLKASMPFAGTYNIGSDNRGAFTIDTAAGSRTYAVVVNSIASGVAEKGRFVEFDDTIGTSGQRGSGVLRRQDTTAFAQSKVTGPYAFGFDGQDATGNREGIVGSFNTDGTGTISTGLADQNIAGTANNPTLTGSYTAPSINNGRATMKLNTSSALSLDLSVYIVSGNEFLIVTTNAVASDGLLSGTVLSRTSNSFDNGSLNAAAVYYQLGVNPSSPTAQSFAESGLLSADGSGGITVTYDKKLGSAPVQGKTFAASYAVQGDGRVSISGWYGDGTNPLRILYLVDKNKAFFLDASAGVGFGFVEPQSAAPPSGFSNASLSGNFSAATASPSVSPNPNGCGLASLDGSGNFTQITNLSSTSGLSVDQGTTGAYSIATNGRGTVTRLAVVSAGLGGPILGAFVVITLLLSCRKMRRNTSRPGFATFCFTILLATTPASCPQFTNQLVFYEISPTKVVMFHEATFDSAPVMTIIEK
jgi:hypothetical protein